ncbi:hypothetical protein [Pseudoalteromonas prydzensis]|uniref:hypothetical protein n=1 Tax=Pseudoalteromonas prydzensis TaxID=182141 RepID=UPI003FD1852A
MANSIQMLSDSKFHLKARGNDFTLEKGANGKWYMTVMNAAVEAYNNGFAMPKEFDTLEQVEQAYKSWKGISQLVNLN